MRTDYTFWYVLRSDDIHIDEVAVRFYEGNISSKFESDVNSVLIPVVRYRRIRRLQLNDLSYLTSKKARKETNGNDAIIYTPEDFGFISSDDELRVFMNTELRRDPTRIPIDEQNTLDIGKVK